MEMPQELPYLASYKNVGLLFEKIKAAKAPEAFTQKFLHDTLGLKSKGDRALIALLKSLGFIENSGKPTPRYAALKNDKIAGIEIARGIREAYAPLFAANEDAHELATPDLKGLVAQVSGADSGTASKILGTLKALLAIADFKSDATLKQDQHAIADKEKQLEKERAADLLKQDDKSLAGMRPEFHYNLQIHLPTSGSEDTYMNIFNAIRKVFK
jgi:hypothetical protein